MTPQEIIRKLVGSSRLLQKAVGEVYERMPVSVRNRVSFGKTFFLWLAFLKESECWDEGRWKDYQIEQLRHLLRQASRYVPYYRKLFAECEFNPESVTSPEDLRTLPYLSKETVRNRLQEFIDESIPRSELRRDYTSGSSGIVLPIFRTRKSNDIYNASLSYLLERIGYTPASREICFYNLLHAGSTPYRPLDRRGNKLIFSNQHLSDDWLHRYGEAYQRFRPEFISGCPSSLSLFASFLRRSYPDSRPVLRAAIFWGETVDAWQRKVLTEVFSPHLFSIYALREGLLFGGSCEHEVGIHLCPHYGIAEFLDLSGNLREIIGTGFTNYAMPLVRYRTGDLIREGAAYCDRCGRKHPFIGDIDGRVNNILIGRNGEILPSLYPLFRFLGNVRQCQFVQEEPGKVHLKVVRSEGYGSHDTSEIMRRIDSLLGPLRDAVDIELSFVDAIPKTDSGKTKVVDQRLDVRTFLER